MKNENKKAIIAFILGIVISSCMVVSAKSLIDAKDVSYKDENLQSAITKVYESKDKCSSLYNCEKVYYSVKDCDTLSNFDKSNSDYTTIGKKVFAKYVSRDNFGVCIIKNSKLECFKTNNYEKELEHLNTLFAGTTCGVNEHGNDYCDDGNFTCFLSASGDVHCDEIHSSRDVCEFTSTGKLSCGKI